MQSWRKLEIGSSELHQLCAAPPARGNSDALYALDTISFRIEVFGSVQSSLPNRRTAGTFGESSVPCRKFSQP